MRLFLAVNFDDSVRDAIRAALNAFPIADPPWRWAAPETWHVTLKFLGETRKDDATAIETVLDTVRVLHRPFPLSLGKFGAFPNFRTPRVLFYGVDTGAQPLAALAGDIDRALEAALGIPPEERDFHGHATVARLKDATPRSIKAMLEAVPPLSHPVTRVASFDLMESRLGRTGATYSTVKRFAMP
jgi:2'-5' RNA ligase